MILIPISVILVIAYSSLFVIDQAEQGILVQLGEPVGEVISKPGLRWKKPFIQEVRRFDKRLLAWDGDVSQIPTLGREFILVDTTARWRIVDPLQFLRSVRDEMGARTRLDDIIDSVVRDIVSSAHLEEIVRSHDWDISIEDLDDEVLIRTDVDLDRPQKGRELLEQEMLAGASRLMPQMGIELIDVRIKRINYIDSVRSQVEKRMISERQSIAARFRSEGQGKSEEILGNMERELRQIRSAAERQAAEIQGKADAEATRIYGEAYAMDSEFYSFFRTLETYKVLGKNTTLMIRADSEFFRYIESTKRP
ncbi:MAG TPA: protease modulator HflC [Planctomycetes bacterium]|nr:protease modulator HflC [Planctomycetota bacterium]